MADPILPDALRGLALSAQDLRSMFPDWPEAFIEDYLSLLDNISTIAGVINQKGDKLKVTRVVEFSESPYEIADADEDVFFDTTDGDIVANLRPSDDGQNFRLIHAKGSNMVTVNPFAGDTIFEAAAEVMYPGESLIITYDAALKDWE